MAPILHTYTHTHSHTQFIHALCNVSLHFLSLKNHFLGSTAGCVICFGQWAVRCGTWRGLKRHWHISILAHAPIPLPWEDAQACLMEGKRHVDELSHPTALRPPVMRMSWATASTAQNKGQARRLVSEINACCSQQQIFGALCYIALLWQKNSWYTPPSLICGLDLKNWPQEMMKHFLSYISFCHSWKNIWSGENWH